MPARTVETVRSDPMAPRSSRSLIRAVATVAAVATAAVAAVVVSSGGGRTVQAAGELCIDAGCGAGGEYHALTPVRVLDTRIRALDVAPFGRKPMKPKSGDSVFELPIVGKGGLPAFVDADSDGVDDNVLAVALNITVVTPTKPGYLRGFGTGATEGDTAIVNFTTSAIVPNSTILRPGTGGKLSIRLVSPSGLGNADVVVDMFGWFSTSNYPQGGARLLPAGPGRLLDTREARFGPNPLSATEQVKVPIRGADSFDPAITNIVPNSPDVVAVLVNISAVNIRPGSRNTYLSALPSKVASGKIPATATVNVGPGEVRSALALVPVGSDGAIWIYNRFGDIDVTVDLMGYLIKNQPENTRAGRVVPLVSPFRAFDTRAPEHFSQPLPPGNAEDWSFEAFVNDVKIGADPVGAQLGLIGNLTGARLARVVPYAGLSSYITAYPTPANSSTPKPTTANLTLRDGDVVPNMVVLRYGSNSAGPYQIRFYNKNGFLDYVLDVSAVILAD
jgi:hypothetical protein